MGGRGSASGQARNRVVNEEGRFTARDISAALAGGQSVQLTQSLSSRDTRQYHATIGGRRREISAQTFNALQRKYSPRIVSSEGASDTYALSQEDWVRRSQRQAANQERARRESGVTDEMRRAERESARQQRQSESMLMRSIRWS